MPALMKSSMRFGLPDERMANTAMMAVAINEMPAGRYKADVWQTAADKAMPKATPAVNVNEMVSIGYSRNR